MQIIGDVLVDRQSLAVFHINQQIMKLNLDDRSEETIFGEIFEGYNTIDEIVAPDAVIGFFEDDFMLITNTDFDNPIDVEVKTSSELLILDNDTGEWSELESKSFSLEAGDAALIKITE